MTKFNLRFLNARLLFRPSIARRMFITLLIACSVVWMLVYAQEWYHLYKPVTGLADQRMKRFADAAVQTVEENTDPSQLRMVLSGLTNLLDGREPLAEVIAKRHIAFRILNANGNLLAKTSHAPPQSLGELQQTGFLDAELEGESYRAYIVWTNDHKYRVEVSQSKAGRQEDFDLFMYGSKGIFSDGLLTEMLIGFPLLLFSTWIAIYTGLRPLRDFSRQLSAPKSDDAALASNAKMYVELIPIINELTATLTHSQTLLKRERNFLADAAHELRTPLALIAAQAENLQRAQEPKMRDEAVRRLGNGLARTSRLVNQLLALARLEANTDDVKRVIDMADVIRDCLAAHAIEAMRTQIEISYIGPDSAIVKISGDTAESILNNLVSNAVRYGRHGGQVVVELAVKNQDCWQLMVSDDGSGIALEDRPHIFERFRRGNAVTSSGSGLGLAIVASALRQLGASIMITEGLDGRGVSFSITKGE